MMIGSVSDWNVQLFAYIKIETDGSKYHEKLKHIQSTGWYFHMQELNHNTVLNHGR